MTTLSSSRISTRSLLAAAFASAPVLALAHDTGAPHGAGEHLALYLGVAGLLAIAGVAIAAFTGGHAERRIRVERDDQRKRERRHR